MPHIKKALVVVTFIGALLAFRMVSVVNAVGCSGASPSWTAASAGQTDVQACISSANPGDTVHIPAGNVTWTASVVDNKGLNFVGAGSKSTEINYGGFPALLIDAAAPATFSVSNIWFNRDANVANSAAIQMSGNATPANGWKIFNNQFSGYGDQSGANDIQIDSPSYGVIFSNTFNDAGLESISIYMLLPANQTAPWSQSLQQIVGTTNIVFVEGNTWNLSNAQTWNSFHAVTSGRGSRYEARYNTTIKNGTGFASVYDAHGYCGTYESSGSQFYDIHNNLITDNGGYGWYANIRGGNGLVHDNSFSGSYGPLQNLNFEEYRADVTDAVTYGCVTKATNSPDLYPMIYQTTEMYDYNNGSTGYSIDPAQYESTYLQVGRDIHLNAPTAWTYKDSVCPNVWTGLTGACNSTVPGALGYNAGGGTTDVTPPSVPAGLQASAISSSQINLTWSASTDNVGVTGYTIFRNGVKVGTSATNSYSDTGLSASTQYSYTVNAFDASSNTSAQSNAATATTQNASGGGGGGGGGSTSGIGFVQAKSTIIGSGGASSISASFTSSVKAGDAIVAAIGFRNSTDVVNGCSDSLGNTFSEGMKASNASADLGTDVWYAMNVNGGADSVTCTFSTSVPYDDLAIHEYSGIATANALYGYEVSDTEGSYSTTWSAGIFSTNSSDLIFTAFQGTTGRQTLTPGQGLTKRIDNGSAANFTTMDTIQSAAGRVVPTANSLVSDTQLNVMVVFSPSASASTSTPDTTPPSAPTGLSASSTSSSQINLAWTASTDNVGVTGYWIYRNGVKVGTATTNSYSDTGLSASTQYSYTVYAFDAAGNVSASSATASVTTKSAVVTDTTPPSAPGNLSASGVSSSEIDLTWTASTDNVGVTGYSIFRNGVKVGTATTNAYADTGLSASTQYSYTVYASDAAGNVSASSATASATTQATAVPPGTIGIGSSIVTLAKLNVRKSASMSGAVVGIEPIGAQGTVIAGPTKANGKTWWQIAYQNGVTGWSAGNYIALVISSTPVGVNVPPAGSNTTGLADAEQTIKSQALIQMLIQLLNLLTLLKGRM